MLNTSQIAAHIAAYNADQAAPTPFQLASKLYACIYSAVSTAEFIYTDAGRAHHAQRLATLRQQFEANRAAFAADERARTLELALAELLGVQ